MKALITDPTARSLGGHHSNAVQRVQVCQEVLASDEYLARLAEADLLLLPYDPDVYRRRGPGAFSDAHHVGIPVVAPKECAFARPALDDGWGVAMKDL